MLILVVMTGAIISVICLGALLAQNVQLTQAVSVQRATEARWGARSGVAVSAREIVESSNWRTTRTPGNWYSSIGLNGGSWTLNASDPTDSSFSDSAVEPVLLLGTGRSENTVQKTSSLHQVESVLRQPTMFLAVCGDALAFDNVNVNGAGWIGSRGSVTASGSNTVQCDLMTTGTVTGITLPHRALTGATVDALPTYADFSDIVSLGTSVSASSVPTASTASVDAIMNSDFERGDSAWQAGPTGTLVEMSTGGVLDSETVEVTNRSSASSGLTYDVSGIVRNGLTVQVSAAVLPLSSATTFEYSIETTTTSGTTTAGSWTSSSVAAGTGFLNFQTRTGSFTPSWSGRLIKALLKIRTSGSGSAGTQNFRVDDVSLTLTSAPSGKAIYRRVISTATNPFGVTSNANGVYVLNMNGADLTISDSMIVGTLIVQNVGTVTVGNGPVQWRPAKPGLPALIVDGDIVLSYSRFALNERDINVNLNPSDTGDEFGSTDSSLNDFYLPEIRGLIYASDDVTVAGDIRLNGCLMALDDLTLRQRIAFARAPEYQTVPRTATHSSRGFLRESTGVTRAFD